MLDRYETEDLPEDNIRYVTKKIIHVLVSIEALTAYEPVALPLVTEMVLSSRMTI
jgi:hypothetical protein